MTLRDDIIDYLRWHGPATAYKIMCEFGIDQKSHSRYVYFYRMITELYRAGVIDRRYVLARASFNKPILYSYFLPDAEDDRE